MRPAPAGQTRQYRVCLVEWVSHVTYIDAESDTAAVAQALTDWEADGHPGFSEDDSGIDGVTAEEVGA